MQVSEQRRARIKAALTEHGFDGLFCRLSEHVLYFAHYWPHGLGHGVGTAYHEGPSLHAAVNQPLEAGMVLTIEPGIYIEGFAGVRPEDIIVVHEDGAQLLSDGSVQNFRRREATGFLAPP